LPKRAGLACAEFVASARHPNEDPAYRHSPTDTQNGCSERSNTRVALRKNGAGVSRMRRRCGIAQEANASGSAEDTLTWALGLEDRT
jgi:hypothetical protein